ncbi:MAG: hypothetical protein DRP92_02870 [Candidatus Neomarinimicrobiota bacterium]|nr:MAG: hypothetical protein DRP92_02870 [Candidatus Neomarinimicrobiota bacterium]
MVISELSIVVCGKNIKGFSWIVFFVYTVILVQGIQYEKGILSLWLRMYPFWPLTNHLSSVSSRIASIVLILWSLLYHFSWKQKGNGQPKG